MKLKELLKKFGGGACVSVYDVFGDYCKEASYDYYGLPKWVQSKAELKEFLSGDNPNHHVSTCIILEDWWPEVKDRKVEKWGIGMNGHGSPVVWARLENVHDERKVVNENVKSNSVGRASAAVPPEKSVDPGG